MIREGILECGGLTPLVSVLRAIASGSCVRQSITDPVATTTPRGLPAWGPRSAPGTDTLAFTSAVKPAHSKLSLSPPKHIKPNRGHQHAALDHVLRPVL